MTDYQRRQAEILRNTFSVSWRGIARALLVPKSTVSDYLRKQEREEFSRILEKMTRRGSVQ